MSVGRPARSLLLLAAAVSLGLTTLAEAEGARIALVVGNGNYQRIPALDNAVRDARDIADMLRDFGFTVQESHDLDRAGFETFLRTALLNIPEGSELVFFYAGHGIQIGRRNYLLPTDVAFESVYDLPVQSITLDRVVELLSARGSSHVAMIDACRENPFPNLRLAANLDATLFEAKSGFEVFSTPINSLVAFSTSPGQVAYDGEAGGNGPYTQAILASAGQYSDENILTMLADVRQRVYQSTSGRQVPWESSTLVQPFYLVQGGAVSTPAPWDSTTSQPNRSAAPVQEIAVDLAMPFARELPLDDRLAGQIGGFQGDVSVIEAPQHGQLDLAGGALVYRPHLAETSMAGKTEYAVRDRFGLGIGGAEPRILNVSVEMTALACDVQAGDALDLQGVGLYRLPNQIEPRRALAGCTQAVTENPGIARLLYQLGRAQQASGDLKSAYDSFRAAAAAGHIRAGHAAAMLLLSPRVDRAAVPIPLDEAQGNALLDQAIASGDPFAMHSRGLRLLRNGPAEDDRQRGFELLERAAELGHTYSMNELGAYFLDPDSRWFRPERGLTYLRASAERNDIYGYNNLGLVALRGYEDVKPDHAAARDWFERAAQGGHPFAPSNLGRMIMRGQLGKPDPRAAVRWYDMGLARGDGWGGANAAGIILKGDARPLGPADAALRAAKALYLPAPDAAGRARELLDGIAAADLDRATQMILNELGEAVAVDGRAGPATIEALVRAGNRAGLGALPADAGAQERLLMGSRAWWVQNPPRVDLF
ncbi:caspase family protein [Paracoccus denitrificans]|uniref:caspase family protein n=1 Tax=Paracoccus denitrificans TaxID=266 RepID=UPI000CEC919B|nr:caspase family protein [Paracoccus denitrificans]